MRQATILVIGVTLFLAAVWGDDGHNHALTEQEVGSVHFATSCSKAVESRFNHAMALLHSFQYEGARQAFLAIASQDSTCAMAQWGVAMSYYHGLWNNGDMVAGHEAIHRAAQAAAANSKTTTARENSYIEALAEIYKEDGKDLYSHAQAYEQKMGAVQAAYPGDSEAAIFHALTLDVAAPKTDKTFANQKKCGEILEPIFAKQPHHPGVAHYLIHCYDNPVLAEQGLTAARAYAKIAPASAHANHMPSHIFTRVGLWQESIQSNLKSADLAAKAEPGSKNGEARDQRLHALDYLEYAYLQSGQVKQAKAVIEQMNALTAGPKLTLTGDYALAAIPARYVLELGYWAEASGLQVRNNAVPWAQAITWMAVGVGSARANRPEQAAAAERRLESLRDATSAQDNKYWSNQVEVQRREVAAWIADQAGKPDDALKTMRSAAELEESMDKDAVTPGAVIPAREMLAELLLRQKSPVQALVEYEAVLKIAPKRFNALFGAASAADVAGNEEAAGQYYQELIAGSVGDERPELATARKKVGARKVAAGR